MVSADCIGIHSSTSEELRDLSVKELIAVKLEPILGISEVPAVSSSDVASKKPRDVSSSEVSPSLSDVLCEQNASSHSEPSISAQIPASPAANASEPTVEKSVEVKWGRWMENTESSTCLLCGKAFGLLRRRHVESVRRE